MTATSGTPSFPEALRIALDSRASDVHVALPGQVVSYDAATQTADVRPMIRRIVPNGTDEDADVLEDLPVIPRVPIAFPRGGGFFLSFPIAVGDFVLLVFCERDPSTWRRTGALSAPADRRLHSLAHAVAFPGYYPVTAELDDASATNLAIGKDGAFKIEITAARAEVGGSSDAAALASKVNALIANYNAHTHVESGGTTAVPVPQYSSGPADSAKLKLGG